VIPPPQCSALFLLVLGGIMVFYIVVAEAAKTFFYRNVAR